MLSHSKIWAAIDELAKRHGLSASGLARRAGLDPTSFNPSKRVAKDGRQRWPSTESLSKILTATGEPFDIFVQYFGGEQIYRQDDINSGMPMPMIGLNQANAPGFLDSGGFPVGSGWDEMQFPTPDEDGTYALEVSGDDMLPLYRDGDIIIISPSEKMRRGDRVLVCMSDGQLRAKILHRQTGQTVELGGLDQGEDTLVLAKSDVNWLGRIIWASQ